MPENKTPKQNSHSPSAVKQKTSGTKQVAQTFQYQSMYL